MFEDIFINLAWSIRKMKGRQCRKLTDIQYEHNLEDKMFKSLIIQ